MKMLTWILALFCLMGVCAGWVPEVGDYVMVQQSMGTFDRAVVGEISEVNEPLLLISIRPDSAIARLGYAKWEKLRIPAEMTFSTSSIFAVFPWDQSRQLDDWLNSTTQISNVP